MEKKHKKSIIIGGTVLLLVTLILLGLTYAYYRTRIIGNQSEKSISVTSDNLELTYEDGNKLVDAGNILPGDTFTKTFSVTNTGGEEIEYGVYLENVLNEFVNTKDLIITTTCESVNASSGEVSGTCNGLTNYQFPLTNEQILSNEIGVGITHNYSMTVEYVKTAQDQGDDMGKLLSAKIQIYAINDVIDLLVDATNLDETDTVELHSNPKKAYYSEGKYKFVGVPLGTHTLIVKDKDGITKGEATITLNNGDEQNITGNTITINDNTLALWINISSITNNIINLGNIQYDSYYVVELNGTKHPIENLKEVIEESTEEHPATLVDNVVLTKDLNIDATNKDLYLNLGGYELSCDYHCDKVVNITGTSGNLTISNGSIYAKEGMVGLSVGAKSEIEQNINLIVKNDVIVNAVDYGITIFGNKAILDFYATINILGESGFGISGNGNNAGEIINIYEGTEINAEELGSYALYLSPLATTNIYGGTFVADTVIGIKAGTLNIEGGTFTATGQKAELGTTCVDNGIGNAGDVIFVEINDRYKKNININIVSEASLTSRNANIIRIHTCNVSDSSDESNIVNITGKYTTPIVNGIITTYN